MNRVTITKKVIENPLSLYDSLKMQNAESNIHLIVVKICKTIFKKVLQIWISHTNTF